MIEQLFTSIENHWMAAIIVSATTIVMFGMFCATIKIRIYFGKKEKL